MSAGKAALIEKTVPLQKALAKGQGKPGQAAGLLAAPGKGPSAFSRLMVAKAAQEGKKAGTGVATAATAALKDALKNALKTAADVKTAHKTAQVAPTAVAARPTGLQKTREAAESSGNSEKGDGRKKITRHPSATAGSASAVEAALLIMKLLDTRPGKKEEPAAVQAGSVGSRTLSAQHAQGKVLVVDLRKKAEANAENANADLKTQFPGSAEKGPSLALLQRPAGHEPGLEASARQAPVVAPAHAHPLERLREMAGVELLRASTMVLKDGGGEIRLVLKPESLGSVRIRMNVVDNSIDGKIIVDNSAVKQIFDGNIDALKRALTAEGFQMGSLQVSVGGQGGENARQQQEHERPAEVRRVSALDFERNIPGVENLSLGDLMVNLFV